MIPKTIHHCWFGREEKSDLAEKCIASWKKSCPDYEIIEWNEDNYDIASAPLYVRQGIEYKKWAFATDYIRLDVVYQHGGIYLDTDVELVKSFDSILNDKAFMGIERWRDCVFVNTAVFGAEKGTEFISNLKKIYEPLTFISRDDKMNLEPNTNKASVFFY